MGFRCGFESVSSSWGILEELFAVDGNTRCRDVEGSSQNPEVSLARCFNVGVVIVG